MKPVKSEAKRPVTTRRRAARRRPDDAAAEARKARYLASRDAREEAVAHLTAADLAEYRKNNPLPAHFWDRL